MTYHAAARAYASVRLCDRSGTARPVEQQSPTPLRGIVQRPVAVPRIDSPTPRPPIPHALRQLIAARGNPVGPQSHLVHCLSLFDLDQRAAEILGVQEQHRLAVGADLRLAVAEHPRACAQSVARRLDVGDLVADVVNAAVRDCARGISRSARRRPAARSARSWCWAG